MSDSALNKNMIMKKLLMITGVFAASLISVPVFASTGDITYYFAASGFVDTYEITGEFPNEEALFCGSFSYNGDQ